MLWLLHWAFVREKVHLARLPGLLMGATLRKGSKDSTSKLGGDIGGSMNMGFEAPADAYAVKHAVNRLATLDRQLVIDCALAQTPPDWTPHPVITVERGRVSHAWHLDKRGKKSVSAEFRTFTYRGDLPEIVAARRREYVRWARAVGEVHRMLVERDALGDHVLTADCPPLAPWLDADPNH